MATQASRGGKRNNISQNQNNAFSSTNKLSLLFGSHFSTISNFIFTFIHFTLIYTFI